MDKLKDFIAEKKADFNDYESILLHNQNDIQLQRLSILEMNIIFQDICNVFESFLNKLQKDLKS